MLGVLLRLFLLAFFLGSSALASSNSSRGLYICVKDSPDPVSCGKEVTYTVEVKNNNSTILTGAEFGFQWFNDGVYLKQVVPLTGGGWQCDRSSPFSKEVVCRNRSGMPPGRVDRFKVVLGVAKESNPIRVYAYLKGVVYCYCEASVGVWESTRVCCSAVSDPCDSFSVSMRSDKERIKKGEKVRFTVEVRKDNGYSPNGKYVSFDIYWSGNLKYVWSSSGFSCTNYGDHIHCCRNDYDWGGSLTYLDLEGVSPGEGKVELKNFRVEGSYCDSGTYCSKLTYSKKVTVSSPRADLSVKVSDSPDPVSPGQKLTYSLTVSNGGPDEAVNSLLSVSLSRYLNSPQYSYDGVHWYSLGNSVNLGTLRKGAYKRLYIRGTLDSDYKRASLSSSFSVSSSTPDPYSSNNSAAEYTRVVFPDLTVSISDYPDPVAPSQLLTYRIKVKNSGDGKAYGVILEDRLPSYLLSPVYSLDGGLSWKPWKGSAELGDFQSSQEKELLLRATVSKDYRGTSILNSVSVKCSNAELNLENNSASERTALVYTDLQVSIADSPDPISPGRTLTYKITVKNLGPSVAKEVIVKDELPSALLNTYYSLDSGVTWNRWSGALEIGDLAVGSSRVVLVRGELSKDFSGSCIENRVSVTTVTADVNPKNNVAVEQTKVIRVAPLDLEIKMTADRSTYSFVNRDITYTITVRNLGSAEAQNVEVVDLLPSDLLFVSINPPSGWSCSSGTGEVRCRGSSLRAGGEITFILKTRVKFGSGDEIVNSARVSTSSPETDLSNNQAQVTVRRLIVELNPPGGGINPINSFIKFIPTPSPLFRRFVQ